MAFRSFAGRIDGRLELDLQLNNTSYDITVFKLSDAGATLTNYLSGLTEIGLGGSASNTSRGSVSLSVIRAITNVFLILLFVYARGPISSGHFEP